MTSPPGTGERVTVRQDSTDRTYAHTKRNVIRQAPRGVFVLFRNPTTADHGVPLLFNLGFLAMLVLLFGGQNAVTSLVDLSGRAITCLTGYLRPRPEPRLEASSREAFAEIDRELAAILHQTTAR